MNLDTRKYPDSEPTGDSSYFSSPEETISSIEYSNKLQKINTFLGKIESNYEDSYRDILLALDKDNLSNLLEKSNNEILIYLIQAQINPLESKGFGNLNREEKIKFAKLNQSLRYLKIEQEKNNSSIIALEKEETEAEKEETRAEKEETEAEKEETEAEKEETRAVYNKVNSNIDLLKGSLAKISSSDSKVKSIIDLVDDAISFKIDPEKHSKKEIEIATNKINEKLLEAISIIKSDISVYNSIKKSFIDSNQSEEFERFKTNLIQIDSSLKLYFSDYDSINKVSTEKFSNVSFKSSDILEKLESNKGAVVDVDLEKNPPSSNMRLIGSEYGFEKEIDAQKIESIDLQTRNSVESIEKSFGGIDKFERDFTLLKSDIGKAWGTENFYTNLGDSVDTFVSSSLATLNQTFEGLNIPSELMITQGDLHNLKNINPDNPSELKSYIEKIEDKVQNLKQYLEQQQKEVYVKQKESINQVLKSEKLYENKQVEVLKFLNQTGFDLIPQKFTNQLIAEFKANTFDIPGLELNPETIDLENSRFGESDSEKGGDKWKDNLVKFLEKLLYGEIGYKDSIFKGKEFKGELGSHISPLDFNKALIDSGIKSGTGFDINTMRANLENPIDNSQSGMLEKQWGSEEMGFNQTAGNNIFK